ncbi:hypothetical_protein [Candidozyma auris]|uniref:hypothetical_protein n=1 Tax=Candidozyma auris TaxID=498019 RepID=UPI000D2DEF65|nr:hypothetical_protein [[Candida] auris]QEO23328.1 hypothetical_protein [[Candida] auris]GBL49371.1 hypothetical protein CAJCM15448_16450 [[Candida] auris]
MPDGALTELHQQHGKPEQESQRTLDTQRKLEFITMVRRNMENRKMKESGNSNGGYSPFPTEENPLKMGFGADEIKLIRKEMEELIKKIGLREMLNDRTEGDEEKMLRGDEIMKLQRKIAEAEAEQNSAQEGFSLYGTKDEEGLHAGNGDCGYEDDEYDDAEQDDYDIGELQGDAEFSYEYGPTHHIEVELSDGPVGEGGNRDDEASCEFTFEYDQNGKLVPTYCNVEEQLRFMNLRDKTPNSTMVAPPTGEKTKKNKKKNKKKKKSQQDGQKGQPVGNQRGGFDADLGCLFCQYEAAFGVKPVHMMRWYDQKVMNEERHRQKVREKLERAKSKALKRQQSGYHAEDGGGDDGEESDASRTTVVDQG